ncbi:MAG: tyrosine-type recombinase/integrase, partial [Chloroflexi bacterium]|nr:tyrosine-type recombinase/integrase [Chloroflexota bacterium]
MHVDRYPGVKSIHQWFPANQGFYTNFLDWLAQASYSKHVVKLYAFGARIALGLLDKPYWLLDPVADFEKVQDYLTAHFECEGTRSSYAKGVSKLQQYLLQRCHRPAPERPINWQYYTGSLPPSLVDDLRAYVVHRRRGWPCDLHHDRTVDLLSRLTRSLRWMGEHATLAASADLTPTLWFDYVDARLAENVNPRTMNTELQTLQSFLCFLTEQGRPICERTLKIEPLATGPLIPRDVPVEQLRRLLATIEVDAQSTHAGIRRMGLTDKAWFFLMLHSGLRTGEVRRLRLEDLDLERQRVRIEQSKGLKDRIVCLSETTIRALQAYLEVRGPVATTHVFVYRHLPLTESYCSQRLETYACRCGVRVTPHQFRH